MSSKGNELLALLDQEMDEANDQIGQAESLLGKTELKSDDDEGDDDDDSEQKDALAGKLAGWELRKQKYQGYVEKGKVAKLEKALEKQKAKAAKAVDKGKSPEYCAYKQMKVEYTTRAIKKAYIVDRLISNGLMAKPKSK